MPTFDYSLFHNQHPDSPESISSIPPERMAVIMRRLKNRKFSSVAELHDAILQHYTPPPTAPMADRSPTPKRPRNRRVKRHETLLQVIRREDERPARLADTELYPPHQPTASEHIHRPIPESDPQLPQRLLQGSSGRKFGSASDTGTADTANTAADDSEGSLRRSVGLPTTQDAIVDAIEESWANPKPPTHYRMMGTMLEEYQPPTTSGRESVVKPAVKAVVPPREHRQAWDNVLTQFWYGQTTWETAARTLLALDANPDDLPRLIGTEDDWRAAQELARQDAEQDAKWQRRLKARREAKRLAKLAKQQQTKRRGK